MAGKSDMKMTLIKVGALRCGLPEFVAGKSDMEMKDVPQTYVSVLNGQNILIKYD